MTLQLQGISKSYGLKHALKNVDLQMTEGIYGLLGPNGAGKTTLMNIIVRNLKPSSGRVLFNGVVIEEMGRDYFKHIGYLPQTQIYYPDFTGIEYLNYMASLKGMDKTETNTVIREYLKELGLWNDRGKKLKEYSGGMRQRLLLIQAIMDNPDILILDEPTAGMDPWQRIAVRNLIGKIGLNKIVIISTHVVQDVEQLAEHILFLSDGEIVRDGSPEQLTSTLKENIYTYLVKKENVKNLEQFGTITGIARKGDYAEVRMIVESPLQFQGKPSTPTLEDVYLIEFGQDTL